jgi:hypothetical protein
MDRREFVVNSALLLLGAHNAASAMFDLPLRKAETAFDHILLGAADLDAGIRWVEERTGARAKFGGVHPGAGTRNALLSLGTRHYLEIIAPDPAQPNAPDERGLRKLASPHIIQWAVGTDDIAAVHAATQAAAIKTFGPQPGSRQRPDGKLLRWQVLGIEQTTPLVPFFIQWESGSPHPSSDAPKLGAAKALRFETPQADELRRILRGAGLEADIRRAAAPRIVLTVDAPKGTVELN